MGGEGGAGGVGEFGAGGGGGGDVGVEASDEFVVAGDVDVVEGLLQRGCSGWGDGGEDAGDVGDAVEDAPAGGLRSLWRAWRRAAALGLLLLASQVGSATLL